LAYAEICRTQNDLNAETADPKTAPEAPNRLCRRQREIGRPVGGNVETNLDFSMRQQRYDGILNSSYKGGGQGLSSADSRLVGER
jgi:hypothetical protein